MTRTAQLSLALDIAPRKPVVLSYGGGLDSWTLLLRAVELGMRIDLVVFADVGNPADRTIPGEWPSTYRHIEDVAIPFCEAHGIEFVTLSAETGYPVRGDYGSLYEYMRFPKEGRGIQVPVCSKNKRNCTIMAKIERYEAYIRDRFGSVDAVVTWIGFAANEMDRVEKDPNNGTDKSRRDNRYPLVEWNFCRCREEAYCRASGYPVPRKSACVFCPMGTRTDWQNFARELPEQFALIAQLEADKPVTKNGEKIAIKGYGKLRKDGTRNLQLLPEWVSKPGKPQKRKPCPICGAAEQATKETACSYLYDPTEVEVAA